MNDSDEAWAAKEILRIGRRSEDAAKLADAAIEADKLRRMRQIQSDEGKMPQSAGLPVVQGESHGKWQRVIAMFKAENLRLDELIDKEKNK